MERLKSLSSIGKQVFSPEKSPEAVDETRLAFLRATRKDFQQAQYVLSKAAMQMRESDTQTVLKALALLRRAEAAVVQEYGEIHLTAAMRSLENESEEGSK